MTKRDFLNELQRTLTNKMSATAVAEHVNFYCEYIEVEVRKGKKEEAVVEELGSPRLIAKSILTAAASEQGQESDDSRTQEKENGQNIHNEWYRTIPGALALIVLLIILLLLVAFLSSVIGILLPILLPIVLIVLLVKIWKKYRS